MKLNIEKKSGLKYLYQPGNENAPTVIMLHGYGANAADLFSIASIPFINELNLNWFFLEGPLSPPEVSMFGGRAWFNIDINHFQRLIMEGRFKEYYQREPEGIDQLQDKIETFIKTLDIEHTRLILGGFSQGAMVATDHIYAKKIKPLGLIHFSGTVIRQKLWINGSLQGLPIYQSHGHFDQVLPVQGAQHFKSISKSKEHRLDIFQGGHEIPIEILLNCKDYLKNLI